jgi:hypothetical protein
MPGEPSVVIACYMAGRLRIGLSLLAALACSRRDRSLPANPGGSPSSFPVSAVVDSRVDPEAQNACLAGDTLLRRVPGTVLRRPPPVLFDSVWHDSAGRYACRVAAIGHVTQPYAPVDSLMRWLKDRGWIDQTTISADGTDGTVQGVHRRGVTCLVEGRWDGGDPTDTTYVPSDTIEVHLACTRTVAADTASTKP